MTARKSMGYASFLIIATSLILLIPVIRGIAHAAPAQTHSVPSATAFGPLGDNLVRVWHHDDATKEWTFYDPAFGESNTLKQVVHNQIYWIRIKTDQAVTLMATPYDLYAEWSLIALTTTPTTTLELSTADPAFFVVGDKVPEDALDLVFVPEAGYGDMSNEATRENFIEDAESMINLGFWHNGAMASNSTLFNFWILTSTGTVEASAWFCPLVTWPNNLATDAEFADAFILLHDTGLWDCASGNRGTASLSGLLSLSSFYFLVHETSHAAFNLPDEYPGGGGYWLKAPVLYELDSTCKGDPDNVDWRACQSITADSGATWWRSENTTNDLMSVGSLTVLEYGPADWAVVESVLSLYPGDVIAPTVFAPEKWP